MTLTIEPEAWGSPVGQALVHALDRDLDERYAGDVDIEGEPDRAMLNVLGDTVIPPHGVFLVARLGGEPVGCGALRRHTDEEAEVKRMYVAPGGRGRGVGRALLAALEAAGACFGYPRLVLETGVRQAEAMALYESAGWTPIGNYGAYRNSPLSRCYEKRI
ncbi:MAG: GNAT family N-acetyltransferase [Acidimicrobiia bacterium]|nr:GNAT family N-acetyltransferase [Acidimicrobiia bacterium]